MHVKVFICAILLLASTVSQAQENTAHQLDLPGTLVYFRAIPDVESVYVQRSGNTEVEFSIPIDGCSIESPDGRYVLQSYPEAATLNIWRMSDHVQVATETYEPDWTPCGFGWINDEMVVILNTADREDSFYFRMTDDGLEATIFPERSRPEPPKMPGYYAELYVYAAPDRNQYLYQQCSGEIVYSWDKAICSERSRLVIYSVTEGRVLHEVTETTVWDLMHDLSASWSSDGRYLAFERTQLPPDIPEHLILFATPLVIYDTLVEELLEPNYIYYVRDPLLDHLWSPDSTRVTIWLYGEVGLDVTDRSLRNLMIYDTASDRFTIAQDPHHDPHDITWAPDSQSIVFIADGGNLVYVDAYTGAVTVLDTQVTQVVAWRAD